MDRHPRLEATTMTTLLNPSPSTLRSREMEQERIDEVRAYFDGRELEPIVVVDMGGWHEILDGHHRAMIAAERGCDVPAVVLTKDEFEALDDEGYGALTIAHAALMAAGQAGAAFGIEAQGFYTYDEDLAAAALEMLTSLR